MFVPWTRATTDGSAPFVLEAWGALADDESLIIGPTTIANSLSYRVLLCFVGSRSRFWTGRDIPIFYYFLLDGGATGVTPESGHAGTFTSNKTQKMES
jgi:hypothetical protein